MKPNFDNLMVILGKKEPAVPIGAIQSIDPVSSVSCNVYFKEDYLFDGTCDKSYLIVIESAEEIKNRINETIIDANRKLLSGVDAGEQVTEEA